MDKDLIVCVVAIFLCQLIVYVFSMKCPPISHGKLQVREMERLKKFSTDQVVPDVVDASPSEILTVQSTCSAAYYILPSLEYTLKLSFALLVG